MKRLLIAAVAVITMGLAAPCVADPIGLFTGVLPPDAGAFENKVLWLIFAPQPEPPKIARTGDDVIAGQYGGPTEITSLLVGIAIEGAPLISWGGMTSGRVGIEPSPFSLSVNANLRVTGGGPIMPAGFDPGATAPTISLPPGAPAGMTFLWGEFLFCNPQPGAACGEPYAGVIANDIELWVGAGTADAKVPLSPVPEPASLLLLGTGLIGLRTWRKRRG